MVVEFLRTRKLKYLKDLYYKMAILKNTRIQDTGFLKVATGTQNQQPSNDIGLPPSAGMIRFNTTFNYVESYDGTD